ncbi:MAG: RidA family protein [Daejeonella sp.]
MKKIIYTQQAPAPIGPYSQAVIAGNMLYVSGQIAINPLNNKLIDGDIEQETAQVMENISQLLNQAGYTFNNIVKTTIFLSSMQHFEQVNKVYGSYFTSDFPARETVAVSGLPKNVNVEISVTAYKN